MKNVPDCIFATVHIHVPTVLRDFEESLATEEELSAEVLALLLHASPALTRYNRILTLGPGWLYTRSERSRRTNDGNTSDHVPILRSSVLRLAEALLSTRHSSTPEILVAEMARQRPQTLCCMYDTVRDRACSARAVASSATTPSTTGYVYCAHHSGLQPFSFPWVAVQTAPSEEKEQQQQGGWSDGLF